MFPKKKYDLKNNTLFFPSSLKLIKLSINGLYLGKLPDTFKTILKNHKKIKKRFNIQQVSCMVKSYQALNEVP